MCENVVENTVIQHSRLASNFYSKFTREIFGLVTSVLFCQDVSAQNKYTFKNRSDKTIYVAVAYQYFEQGEAVGRLNGEYSFGVDAPSWSGQRRTGFFKLKPNTVKTIYSGKKNKIWIHYNYISGQKRRIGRPSNALDKLDYFVHLAGFDYLRRKDGKFLLRTNGRWSKKRYTAKEMGELGYSAKPFYQVRANGSLLFE